jgi:hypothetical protein
VGGGAAVAAVEDDTPDERRKEVEAGAGLREGVAGLRVAARQERAEPFSTLATVTNLGDGVVPGEEDFMIGTGAAAGMALNRSEYRIIPRLRWSLSAEPEARKDLDRSRHPPP